MITGSLDPSFVPVVGIGCAVWDILFHPRTTVTDLGFPVVNKFSVFLNNSLSFEDDHASICSIISICSFNKREGGVT